MTLLFSVGAGRRFSLENPRTRETNDYVAASYLDVTRDDAAGDST